MSLEGQDDGSIRVHLWMEAGWKALLGIGWQAPPNGARVWETSYYSIVFPDGTKFEGQFPGAQSSQTIDVYSDNQPYQAGTWTVTGNYGIQMKDVLGRWGSNIGATPTWEFHVPDAEQAYATDLPGRAHLVTAHVEKVLNVDGASGDPVGGDYYRVVAKHSGKVLTIDNESTANGALLIQWPWYGGGNQRFQVRPFTDETW
ncbi:RICIN domain-containing protein [Actinomadura barringtoniae]|uniref:RICIN domain-containing protein n=1 Tax=Actinomadura barringtoniae TaxID=1427535 RepID=A0A939PEQ1_9ACTN|nr:RICIN domain-containing protein [Actinomadura barringtoniae]MBO2451275.1 RICIN domain-containing protein [Actinomadura barringtoniae]